MLGIAVELHITLRCPLAFYFLGIALNMCSLQYLSSCMLSLMSSMALCFFSFLGAFLSSSGKAKPFNIIARIRRTGYSQASSDAPHKHYHVGWCHMELHHWRKYIMWQYTRRTISIILVKIQARESKVVTSWVPTEAYSLNAADINEYMREKTSQMGHVLLHD